jgi:hypothetical protein
LVSRALSGTSATFSGSLTSSGLTSTSNIIVNAGFGILVGGGGFAVSPSATRGIIGINGSGDQFLTLGTNGYILGSAGLCRFLSNPDFDIVVGGSQRLLISASTGAATFSSSVSIGGADQGYQLDVKRTSTGDSTFDTVANFYKASTHNTGLLLRLKNTIVDLAANNITGGGGPTAGMSFSVSSGGTISTALTIASTGAATFSSTLQTAAPTTATAGAMKFGARQAGSAVTAAGYWTVNIDGTDYYINLLSTSP